MTRVELNTYVGKKVQVWFKDGKELVGILGYADEFSEKHGYKKPGYFYIDHMCFKVSHIRKLVESE